MYKMKLLSAWEFKKKKKKKKRRKKEGRPKQGRHGGENPARL